VRDLLCRVARGEGALGAACIAGLLACGLIQIAASPWKTPGSTAGPKPPRSAPWWRAAMSSGA
jgi:hypothetical protein